MTTKPRYMYLVHISSGHVWLAIHKWDSPAQRGSTAWKYRSPFGYDKFKREDGQWSYVTALDMYPSIAKLRAPFETYRWERVSSCTFRRILKHFGLTLELTT